MSRLETEWEVGFLEPCLFCLYQRTVPIATIHSQPQNKLEAERLKTFKGFSRAPLQVRHRR